MSDYEDFITAVDFLKDKYGIVKQTIADEICYINKVAIQRPF